MPLKRHHRKDENDFHRISFLRLAEGGRIILVLRARLTDRPQRPGAPQIVAPISGKHAG